INPNIPPSNVVKDLIFDSSYIGLRGLTLVGIMALVMSTADSYINSTSVLIVHDFCRPLGINLVKNELSFARLVSLLIGVFSIILGLQNSSLLELEIAAFSFYMPIVTVPFTMSLLGFRSSGKSVLIGMMAGFVTVVVWKIFFTQIGIDGLVPGMLANLVFLLGSHYILQQQGGWVGIKDYGYVLQRRFERRAKIRNFIKACRNFSLSLFLRKNSPSRGESGEAIYVYLGFFCMVSIFSSVNAIGMPIRIEYSTIMDFIYISVIFTATLLLAYPLWLASWRNTSAIYILWHSAIFFILICISFLLVIISKFAPLPFMAFMINIMVISVLVRWQLALLMIVSGLLLTMQFCKNALGANYLQEQYAFAHFEITYLLLVVSGIFMAFLRPKQDWQQLTEEKTEHLSARIDASQKQIKEARDLKDEFIRNVSNESGSPIADIVTMAESLQKSYDKLSEEERIKAIGAIFESSKSLKVFDENIATLSRLNKPNYKLEKEKIDFSDLVYDRLNTCRRLYEENQEDREFILDIKEGIIANLDKDYMTQMLDNLIINAITYCKKGKIHISLSIQKDNIKLVIQDEGPGISKYELYEIFDPFTVSSNTKTPALGRGVGLAMCKRILEVHQGTITADSNGELGASFTVSLPI
ncbi:MAG: ATP-binding protein, partial [Rickettsiaceae bacterium]|nr:ATP-binding protein [Rickettsiaceae bacterium]